MARYQIIFAYDGTYLAGSQRQQTARTAQGEVEAALRKIGWQQTSILMAARTDTGVHAQGQVAAFDLEWQHSPEELTSALNSHLPEEVAVQRTQQTAADFHPRFDALSRRYRYRIYSQPRRDPLRERYAWRVYPSPDEETLQAAAALLPGSHNFSAFGNPPRPGGSALRTVSSALWRQTGDEWIFEIEAQSFLYHMVRRLVFVQVSCGQSKLSLEDLAQMLEGNNKGLVPGLAKPGGLTLMQVRYPE